MGKLVEVCDYVNERTLLVKSLEVERYITVVSEGDR